MMKTRTVRQTGVFQRSMGALAIAAGSFVASFGVVPSANAYEQTMTCIVGASLENQGCRPKEKPLGLHWPSTCVPWRLGDSIGVGSPMGGAIRAAFDTWNAPACSSLTLRYEGTTDQNVVGYDCRDGGARNANSVMLVDDWRRGSQIVALTSVTYQVSTGKILDADIEMNNRDFEWGIVTSPLTQMNTMDVENAMAHEVGHFLGLDHSEAESYTGNNHYEDATMYRLTFRSETKRRQLDSDDIAGLCAIYPTTGKPPKSCEPRVPTHFATPATFDPAHVDCSKKRGCCSTSVAEPLPTRDILLVAALLLFLRTLTLRRTTIA